MEPLKMYLYRLERNDKGTLGVLVADRLVGGEEPTRTVLGCTFEMPDTVLEPPFAYLTPGTYLCQRQGPTFGVAPVLGASEPMFLAAKDTELPGGHILLGESFARLYGDKRAELNTGQTFKSFMEHAGHVDEFDLVVVDLSHVGHDAKSRSF